MSQTLVSKSPLLTPKDRSPVLLLEGVHDSAAELFARAGYTNVKILAKGLEGAALSEALEGVRILGIRSRTQLTGPVLQAAQRLIAVGCFCIGTNQVDLQTARARGIPVFNAPFSNTRSVAELVIGEIIMLLRGIVAKSEAAHRCAWEKSAANSNEVRGKTLGIVGYGNIGSQLSVLAESIGMRVIFFDTQTKLPHGNAQSCASLQALLAEADVATLHVPEASDTMGLIGAAEIALMKPGAVLINNSRGTVVDLEALAAAIRAGKLLGAAVDVFPHEPASNKEVFRTPLQGLPNVILTPHVGGSTAEAQERIGGEVATKLLAYSDTGSTVGAVNFPQVQLPPRPAGARYMHLHRNVPGMLRRINDVFFARGLNISAEYLQTDGDLGYVVVEAEGPAAAQDVLDDLRDIEGTVRARLLY